MLILDHISLTVTDLKRSAQFYCDCFGFIAGEQYRGPDFIILMLHNHTTVIELLEKQTDTPGPRSTGVWDHICFQTDDIDAMYQKLKAQHVELIDPKPRMSIFGKRILFLAGPDGERIELKER